MSGCSRADPLRGDEALVGVGRRHPDVDDRDVGRVAARPARRRPSASSASPTTSMPASAEQAHDALAGEHQSSATTTRMGSPR